MQRAVSYVFVILLVMGMCLPQTLQAKEKAISALDLYLKVGVRYDDNVQLDPLDQDVFADQEDVLGVVYFTGRYKLVSSKAYEISAGYSHYQTFHYNIDNYDLAGSIGYFGGKYRFKSFTFGLSYRPSYYWVDYDRFILYHILKPEVSWKISDKLFTRASFNYSRNNNLRDDNRDGHTDGLFVDAFYTFSKKGNVFGGGGYERNHTKHDDYEYYKIRTKLGVSYLLPMEIKLVATGKYDRKNYIWIDSTENIRRKDRKFSFSTSLSRPLFYEWLGVVFDYTFTRNSSNISDYDYDKHNMTLSLTAVY